MKVENTPIEGLKIVRLQVFGDSRGFFAERYNEEKYRGLGLPTQFVQDNHSRSGPGVLRGLHFQTDPAQGKLVGVIRGKIWDVAVDLRKDSPTFGKHFSLEITGDNGLMLWIPAGFGHGYCVLGSEPADVLYKVDGLYNPKSEGGVAWNDPDLKIPWPVQNPTISGRDQALGSFKKFKEEQK